MPRTARGTVGRLVLIVICLGLLMSSSVALMAKETVVDFWINWKSPVWADAANKLADEFHKANPDITVKVLPGIDITNRPDKTLAAIAAGEPPDVFTLSTLGSFIARGAIVPLDSYIRGSKVVDLKNYFPEQISVLKNGNHYYGIPAMENAIQIGMAYNKNLFKEAGLDPNRPPRTLKELAEISDKLTKLDNAGNLIQIGFDPLGAMGGGTYSLDVWATAFGAQWYDAKKKQFYLNTPKMVEMVDYLASFYQKYGPAKVAAFRGNYDSWTGNPNSSVNQGIQAMTIEGYWTPGEVKSLAKPGIEFGYSWLPTASGEKLQWLGGWSAVMPKGAKHPKEAWKFMEFLTTDKANQIVFDTAGGMVVTKSWMKKGDFSKYPGLEWFVNSPGEADKVMVSPLDTLPIARELIGKFKKGLEEVIYGRTTAKQMLDALEQTAVDAMKNL